MSVTKKDKILIKNMCTLDDYNAKRVSWQRWNIGTRQCLQVVAEATGYWVCGLSSRQWQTTHVPGLPIPLILFTNWSCTKMV